MTAMTGGESIADARRLLGSHEPCFSRADIARAGMSPVDKLMSLAVMRRPISPPSLLGCGVAAGFRGGQERAVGFNVNHKPDPIWSAVFRRYT